MNWSQRSTALRRSRRRLAAGRGGVVLAVAGAIGASAALAWLPAGVASARMAPGQAAPGQAAPGRAGPGRAVEIRAPLNAAPDMFAQLNTVSCTGRRSCVAVGFYANSSGQIEGMAVAKTRGGWGRATRIAPPRNAAADPNMILTGVSCARAGSCAAVGVYLAGPFQDHATAVTESKGRWGRAAEVRPPANGAASTVSILVSVSCTKVRSCVAAGSYRDASGGSQGMAVTESRGRWGHATEIALPANARALSPDALLTSVSCVRAGFCVTTGGYDNADSDAQAMRVTEAGGRWRRARQVAPPSNAGIGNPNQGSFANAVTCARVRSCVAVGYYLITSANREAMAAALPLP